MKLRLLALAALTAASFSANAALTTFAPWDATVTNGTQGVLFNVATAGSSTVAIGAHAYKNGVFLPSDSATNTFTAALGNYEANRANWSFDFAYNLNGCTGCTVNLLIDSTGDSVAPYSFALTGLGDLTSANGTRMDSWNLEMTFLPAFNSAIASVSSFTIQVLNGGQIVNSAAITVNALDANAVPEPGSLALLGLGLVGLGAVARRRKQQA